MKIILKIAALAIVLLLAAGALFLPALEESYGGVYEKTLRFHVLANSDSPEDQALKMKVRDRLLTLLDRELENCTSIEETSRILSDLLPALEEAGESALREEGSDLPVRVVLGREFYPTRDYENLSYPAGDYLSLRVFIGSGEGKNWWCVVFPPLCLDAAKTSDSLARAGYSDDEGALLRKEDSSCSVRFFFLDLASKIRHWFGF